MIGPAFLLSLALLWPGTAAGVALADESSRAHLLRIFDEVRAMGGRPGENFIQQEFFAGGPDDDDTNKDLHVVVLIQPEGGRSKITVQVTRFERDRRDRNVKIARETKTTRAEVVEGAVKGLASDYEDVPLHEVLEQVEQAVRQKKKLLLLEKR